jgi:hypothetical protein
MSSYGGDVIVKSIKSGMFPIVTKQLSLYVLFISIICAGDAPFFIPQIYGKYFKKPNLFTIFVFIVYMDITKKQEESFKFYLIKISDGLITDVDFFVNYMGAFPELNIMVDVNWELLPPDRVYNYNLYLKEKFSDYIKFFFKMTGISFNGRIEFDILNWSE